ncbi:hypothetical protein GCM10017710_15810 [Arthrobacter ramosus]
MRYFKAELLIALSTCSSQAVLLPQLIKKLENMGVGKSTVGIVIPSGFSFNLDGSAVYLTMASVFLVQAVGMDLSWEQQLVMVGVMMLTSKALQVSPAARSPSWPAHSAPWAASRWPHSPSSSASTGC